MGKFIQTPHTCYFCSWRFANIHDIVICDVVTSYHIVVALHVVNVSVSHVSVCMGCPAVFTNMQHVDRILHNITNMYMMYLMKTVPFPVLEH